MLYDNTFSFSHVYLLRNELKKLRWQYLHFQPCLFVETPKKLRWQNLLFEPCLFAKKRTEEVAMTIPSLSAMFICRDTKEVAMAKPSLSAMFICRETNWRSCHGNTFTLSHVYLPRHQLKNLRWQYLLFQPCLFAKKPTEEVAITISLLSAMFICRYTNWRSCDGKTFSFSHDYLPGNKLKMLQWQYLHFQPWLFAETPTEEVAMAISSLSAMFICQETICRSCHGNTFTFSHVCLRRHQLKKLPWNYLHFQPCWFAKTPTEEVAMAIHSLSAMFVCGDTNWRSYHGNTFTLILSQFDHTYTILYCCHSLQLKSNIYLLRNQPKKWSIRQGHPFSGGCHYRCKMSGRVSVSQ